MSGPILLTRAHRWRNGLPVFLTAAERDLNIPSPMQGEAVYVDDGTSAEGLQTFSGTGWRPVAWNTSWGLLTTPVVRTTAQTGIGTSLTDLTGMTFTVTAIGNRWWKITFSAFMVQNTGAGIPELDLVTGASGAGTTVQLDAFNAAGAGAFKTVGGVLFVAPAAGATAYHLRAKTSASTTDVSAATTQPTILGVEDSGPSGAPV